MPSIILPNELDSIHSANEFLHKHIQNHNKLHMIELALEEILVNVINYAYSKPEKVLDKSKLNLIELGIRKVSFDNRPFYSIWVKDWGQAFNPFKEAPEHNFSLGIEEKPIGGLGVHLIKTVSSHQCYSNDDGSNIVEIYFAENDESEE